MPTRDDYLAYIRAAYARERDHLADEVARWQEQFRANAAWNALFGYSPPRWPLHMAAVAAFLYEQTGDPTYAAEATYLLLRFPEWTRLLPIEVVVARPEYTEGVPPLDTTFDPLVYGAACARIRPAVLAATYDRLAAIAADSLRPIWRFPEWGGHNRALLRAASLAVCARAFPDHEEARAWIGMADELAEESWGRWSIEDAMMYQAHWLRALIQYAEARDRRELADFVQPRLTLRAAGQLMSPLGVLPDFGDSQWQMLGRWEWLACLEWGAATYGDPLMKWAARRLWETSADAPPDISGAQALLLAWRWCDDGVTPAAPAGPDRMMRWTISSSRRSSSARAGRNALRTPASTTATKAPMAASHTTICAPRWPSPRRRCTTAMRTKADSPCSSTTALCYCTRAATASHRPMACTAPTTTTTGSSGDPTCRRMMRAATALRDRGHYRPVTTERLYLTRLGDMEIARVRVTDDAAGVSWDRSVCFLPAGPGEPGMPCWVVIDAAIALARCGAHIRPAVVDTDVLARGTRLGRHAHRRIPGLAERTTRGTAHHHAGRARSADHPYRGTRPALLRGGNAPGRTVARKTPRRGLGQLRHRPLAARLHPAGRRRSPGGGGLAGRAGGPRAGRPPDLAGQDAAPGPTERPERGHS